MLLFGTNPCIDEEQAERNGPEKMGKDGGRGQDGGGEGGGGGGVRDAQFGKHIFPPHIPFIPLAISKRVTGIQNTTFTKPERWTDAVQE